MYPLQKAPLTYFRTISIGLVILFLCLMPSSEIVKIHVPITFADFIAHFLMFFAFSIALFIDILRNNKSKKRNRKTMIMVVFFVSFVFGIITELLQYFIAVLNRTGTFSDFAFDCLGTIAAIFIMRPIVRRFVPAS